MKTSRPLKVRFTVTIRADVDHGGPLSSFHEQRKVVELSNIRPDTTAEQAVEWFVSTARDGWRRYFSIIGLAMRCERSPKNTPIPLRALPGEDLL